MSGTFVHPTAIVSPDAQIGEGVCIGAYSIVEAASSIGDGSIIEPYVRIKEYVNIGKNCHIYENAVLGGIPQDHDFGGEISYVRIADDVTIRENVTVNRATGEGAETSIGRGCMLMEGVHVAHNVRLGAECTITNKVGFSGHVKLGDYVVIGGLTGFHQFVRVGSYAMVGGLAKIIKDIPPYSMVDGHPGRVYGLNNVGLRRRGFSQEDRIRIKRSYKVLYDKGLGMREAVELLKIKWGDDEFAHEIAEFAESSKRGLTPWTDVDVKGIAAGDGRL